MKLAPRAHSLARYPRDFTFYVADPISSIPDLWQQEAVRALQPPHLTILVSRGTTTYGA